MEVEEICINDVPNGLAVSIGRIDKKVETKTGDFVTSQAAGEWGMGAHTGGRFAPTRDEISKLAYSLYESRGRQDGHDTEDWGVQNSNSSTTTRNCQHRRRQPMKS
jgi:Protein of unknown function (DUF2934)